MHTGGFAEQHHALEVGSHHPVVLLIGGVDERLGQLQAGIVDEDVQAAGISDGLRHPLGGNGRSGAAAGDDRDPAAEVDRKGHAETGVESFQVSETRARVNNVKLCSDRVAFALVGKFEKLELIS
jgi:hypothetical protein